MKPDYVPQALTASGVFALYASVYAAHALFGLIGIPAAFVALAAVSFAGLVLAVRQGWFVALLGLAGGYAVPALLESDAPAAVPVFVYLFVLTTGCLAVMRFRNWPFLAIATLAGCIGWPLLWIAGPWTIADQGVLSLYAVAVAGVFALLSIGFPVKRPETPATAWLAGMISDTSGMGFVGHGLVLVLLALLSSYNSAAFMFLGFYAVLGLIFGLRRAAYESLGVAGAIIVAIAFLLWPQPDAITIPEELARHGIQNYGDTFGPIVMPVEFLTFGRAALFFAALYGIGGFLALKRVATPPVWAALSAAMPLYLLTLAYWRIGGLELNLQWGAMAAGLSFALLGAASMVDRLVGRDHLATPLSFYARVARGLADGGAVGRGAGAGLDLVEAGGPGDPDHRLGRRSSGDCPASAEPPGARLRGRHRGAIQLGHLWLRHSRHRFLRRVAVVRRCPTRPAGGAVRGGGGRVRLSDGCAAIAGLDGGHDLLGRLRVVRSGGAIGLVADRRRAAAAARGDRARACGALWRAGPAGAGRVPDWTGPSAGE
jgi:hypothetical protein